MTLLNPARPRRPARHGRRPATAAAPAHPGTAVPLPRHAAGPGAARLGVEAPDARPGRARHGGTGVPGHHHPGLRPVPVRGRVRHPHRGHPGRPAPAVGRGGLPGPAGLAARRAGHQPRRVRPRPARHRQDPPWSNGRSPARSPTGTRAIILGDTKPDYTLLIEHLGGQVIRVGRGLDRINPLDAGPLGAALRRMTGPDAQRAALGGPLPAAVAADGAVPPWSANPGSPTPRRSSSAAPSTCSTNAARPAASPPSPTCWPSSSKPPTSCAPPRATDTPAAFRDRTADLVFTLDLLCTGSLAGVFDGPTTRPIDLDAPAVSVDISRVGAAGDKLLTAAMLCTWAYGFGVVDAAAALADQQIAPRRSYMGVMDELWRALRGAPGLVEYADSLTRLNRAKGMAIGR